MDRKQELQDKFGQTWTTDELCRDFEVDGFIAGIVEVRRRSDGARGSLDFDHMPRLYYNWEEAMKNGPI